MTAGGRDTIFALSSGSPPAAIAVVRISGSAADAALLALAGRLPEPRRATLVKLRDADGELLDTALALRFPGLASSTGEDLVELHLHGGRSVVAAVTEALRLREGLRPALPGEFTRRAFENGRIDLAEAEGLGDLLTAETQSQRRAALALAGGALSRLVERWRQQVLALSASIEASIDFSDEGDVDAEVLPFWVKEADTLRTEICALVQRPTVERLRDGLRVSIAGPPNAGKSSLLNAIVGREAAITSAVPGTTRDLVEAPVAIGGIPFLLADTAGLRDSIDPIEAIGVQRARASMVAADIILWLGDPAEAPADGRAIIVEPKADIVCNRDHRAEVRVSSVTGVGLAELCMILAERARNLLPHDGELAVNHRHRALLAEVAECLKEACGGADPIVIAEEFRRARVLLDQITGRASIEDMLDTLFGKFCIGK